jgi:hypothetical protein
MRPRYAVAGGKSDVFDSFVLAELARTDSHRFRILVPDSDQTKALRATTRARESLVRTRIALANQLRDQLERARMQVPYASSETSIHVNPSAVVQRLLISGAARALDDDGRS